LKNLFGEKGGDPSLRSGWQKKSRRGFFTPLTLRSEWRLICHPEALAAKAPFRMTPYLSPWGVSR